MDLEVVGRHALFFDDDAMAAFVNSRDALVDWNSLLIDRYDVRNLLSGPPPPRKRRQHQQTHSPPPVSSAESELDHERYLDLPSPSEEEESDVGAKPVDAGGHHTVAFSYGNADDPTDLKNHDAGSGDSCFHPPFPVPESLLQCIPPTEKVHQIIARTATFVSKHGGQSEIVLRVKQGDNPTFGFLMPDHHLHAYFRFLVDHQELLQSDTEGKSENEKKANTEHKQTDGAVAGALSLLGSVYGSGEDEDGAVEDASESKENVSGKTLDVSVETAGHGSEKTKFSVIVDEKDEPVADNPRPSKERVQVLKRNSFTSAPKAGTANGTKKEGDSISLLSAAVDKLPSSAPLSMSKVEPVILEPPSELKRLVDKIVEFILKNGKQFEAVLIEQDSKHGRFPFLLPSSKYHPYYVKVLQKAQESKLTGKSSLFEKGDSVVHKQDKKSSLLKESDSLSLGSASYDIPYDSDRKEKFRMVIGKSKKDGQEPPSKTSQPQFGVSVDAAAAAAILQAATRGIKNPNLGILSSTSLNAESHGHNSEDGLASRLGSHLSSHIEKAINKSDQKGDRRVPVLVNKTVAKTAAMEATNGVDSSAAYVTREEKLKAERLKRAKMFVAMLKSGAAPSTEPLRSLSVEPPESGVSASGNVDVNIASKEREGSSADFEVVREEKTEMKYSDDEYHERKSRRKYRSRSGRDGGGDEDEDEEEVEKEKSHKHSRKKHRSHRYSYEERNEEKSKKDWDDRHARKKHRAYHSSHDEEDDEEGRDHKHSRKKHRSHRSSDEDEDNQDKRNHKHSRKKDWSNHSSGGEEDVEEERHHKHYRKKHRSHHSSPDGEEDVEEERHHKHSRKKHRSRHSSHHSKDTHKHKDRHSSKNIDSRHRHKHENSSDDKHHISDKHRKTSHSEEELEEGEISNKISDQSRGRSVGAGVSREASLDISSSYQDGRAPSQPSETTEVSDDLRAKIRAMLMATM